MRYVLASDWVRILKAGELRHTTVEGFDLRARSDGESPVELWWQPDLLVIPIEKSEEASLSASRTLYSSESEIIACTLDVPQIPQELLKRRSHTLIRTQT